MLIVRALYGTVTASNPIFQERHCGRVSQVETKRRTRTYWTERDKRSWSVHPNP